MSEPLLDCKGRPLNLRETADAAARRLRELVPSVTFTSGLRSIEEQASAMAQNASQRIASTRRHAAGSEWILSTYKQSSVRDALVSWLDAHPNARSKQAIMVGFLWVFKSFSQDEVARISRHLGGLAFDIQPVDGVAGEAIKTAVQKLPRLEKFLTEEGGLTRWHVQILPE